MSIETSLQSIAKSLEVIADKMRGQLPVPTAVPAAPIPTPAPVVHEAPAPVPVPQAVPTAPVPPAVPAPAPTPAAPAGVTAPFTDGKGVMAYCMEKYRTLGPIKGGMIQGILQQLGHTNLNNLQPDQYADFYAKVEAL